MCQSSSKATTISLVPTLPLIDFQNVTVVRCDEAAWRFLGLSLASYNVLISLALAGIALWGAVRTRRPA